MSPDTNTGYPLHALVRREEPGDLDEQVRALKELQKQPGFVAGKSTTGKKDSGFITIFIKKLKHLKRLFLNKKKPLANVRDRR